MSKEKRNKLKNTNFLPIVFFMIIGGMSSFFGIKIIDTRLELMNQSTGASFFSLLY